MDYKTASSAELAVDHYFIQWVKSPNEESTIFWKNWLENNSCKVEVVNAARTLVILLSQEEEEEYTRELDHTWQMITEARRNAGNTQPDGNTGKVISLQV